MQLKFQSLHPLFAAEIRDLDLREVRCPEVLTEIRDAMDRYGVLVFRDQPLTDADQLAFAERFDGRLHTRTGIAVLTGNRFGNEALTDISNVDRDGGLLPRDDRRRQYGLANRLWHTDASFEQPRGRYSMLSAREVPPSGIADTEFADMRAAYDALEPEVQTELGGLRAHHSIAYSRQILGFEFSEEEGARLEGAEQPLINQNPRTGRRALYLASHASRICGWPLADGRLLLRDLTEHATQPCFVYRHQWQPRDFVIWDNLATMHRARAFDDLKQRRELRRVTTLDVEFEPA